MLLEPVGEKGGLGSIKFIIVNELNLGKTAI